MSGPDFDAYLTDQDRYEGFIDPDAGFGGQDITYEIPGGEEVTVASAASISDPDIRRIFEAGEANGTLRFLYATTPGSTKYWVFQMLVDGVWVDKKMTWTQIIGELGRDRR